MNSPTLDEMRTLGAAVWGNDVAQTMTNSDLKGLRNPGYIKALFTWNCLEQSSVSSSQVCTLSTTKMLHLMIIIWGRASQFV